MAAQITRYQLDMICSSRSKPHRALQRSVWRALVACSGPLAFFRVHFSIIDPAQIDMDELRTILTELDGKAPLPKDLL
jgi:hypothetical protein